MEFSDDIYSHIELSSQTTVDIGDYLAFYKGEFGKNTNVIEYGCITDIRYEKEEMIIKYTDATMDEILASMDMYNTRNMAGEDLLKGIDVAALEADVEKQARDSGFAEEAAMYLAEMALRTDSFTELSEDFNMTDFQVLSEAGDPFDLNEIQLMAGKPEVKVSIDHIKASFSTKLKHFNNVSGVGLSLDIGVKIIIKVSDKDQIVIVVSGAFEEEVRIDVKVKGGARWEWWGPFPYIADYEATANIDLFNFTGININATIVTKKLKGGIWLDDQSIKDISQQIKMLLDSKDEIIGQVTDTKDEILKQLQDKIDGNPSEKSDKAEKEPGDKKPVVDTKASISEGLAKKYQEMLETKTAWITLFEKEIFFTEIQVDPFHILVIELGMDFVVYVDLNVSIGCEFYYENAKSYIYTLSLWAKEVTSDVIDIKEEKYEFVFYAMGMMGIRAGIRANIAFGLFSTSIGSIGFSAEAGVYIRVWGYFYYQMKYTASQGKSSSYSGALLFELGVYMKLLFRAQVGKGLISYNPTLFEHEWPLWTAGVEENVMDFSYTKTEAQRLKKAIRAINLPGDLFSMNYMNLRTGYLGKKTYDRSKDFKIEITNKAFSYDPRANILSVIPGEGKLVEEGQMSITWGGSAAAFTSAPIKRTFDIRWDMLNDGYTILFNTSGGSTVPMFLAAYNTPLETPADPTKTGYIFDGWYTDEAYKTKYVIPKTMPNADASAYAKWQPATDTEYKVEHYKQNLNNSSYTIVEEDSATLKGTTDSIAQSTPKTYAGFDTLEPQKITILPDGSAAMRYYYSRKAYTITFDLGGAGGEPIVYKARYDTPINPPHINRLGYEFQSWDKTVPETMPEGDIKFTAKWNPATDIPYRVEHYIQNENGVGYVLTHIESKEGTTDQTLVISDFAIHKDGIFLSRSTVDGENTSMTQVKANGSLVVKLYYAINNHKVNFILKNGENREKTYRYGEKIEQPIVPAKAGYVFSGWKTNEGLTEAFDFSKPMQMADITIYGAVTPKTDTKYLVEHYYKNTTGDKYSLNKIDEKTGTTDTELEISDLVLEVEGITFEKAMIGNVAATKTQIKGDGSLVIKVYYTRNEYKMTIKIKGEKTTEKTCYFGERTVLPDNSKRDGYTFSGWKTNEELTEEYIFGSPMLARDLTVYAAFTANKNTKFIVEHYYKNTTDDGYTLYQTEKKTGTTDEKLRLIDLELKSEGTTFKRAVVDEEITENIHLKGDGSLVIKLYYTRDEHTLTIVMKNGETTKETYRFGEKIILPDTTAGDGYTFSGWKTNEALTEDFSLEVMPSKDIIVYGKITPNSNTKYSVEHYKQNVTGKDYTLAAVEYLEGETDSETIAMLKTYTGFKAKDFKQNAIAGDGKTIIQIEYDRETYNVALDLAGGIISGQGLTKYTYGIGAGLPTDITKIGYIFNGWFDGEIPSNRISTSETGDKNYTAKWSPITDTAYKIKHLREDLNGRYSIDEIEQKHGVTGEQTDISSKDYLGFTAGRFKQENIAGDGSTEIEIKYSRNSYNLSWQLIEGSLTGDYTQGTVNFEEAIKQPNIALDGYEFSGWYRDSSLQQEMAIPSLMPAEDIRAFGALRAKSGIGYKVIHYLQNANGDGYSSKDVESLTGETNLEVTATQKSYDFCYLNQEVEGTLLADKIKADGSLILKLYYDREVFTVNYLVDEEQYGEEATYKYGEEIKYPTPPEKEGYFFDTWQLDGENFIGIMPGGNITLKPGWTAGAKSYTIRYYLERLDYTSESNRWELDNSQIKSGIFDEQITISPEQDYDGFSTPGDKEVTINSRLSTVDFYYTRNSHQLTWDLGGGTPTNKYTTSGAVRFNTPIIAPTLIKTGHSYTWDKEMEAVMPNEDVGYIAKWSKDPYTVRFDEGGLDSITVTYGDCYDHLPEPSKEGYTFNGWYIDINYSEKIESHSQVKTAKDHTLYARWNVNTYTLNWDLGGGTTKNDYTKGAVRYGATITPPILSKAGHKFIGWDVEIVSIMPAKELTYKANWEIISSTVSFDGLGEQSSITVTYDGTYGELPMPKKVGHTFKGWFVQMSEDSEEILTHTLVTIIADQVLYAHWVVKEYALAWDLDGGIAEENYTTGTVEYGAMIQQPIPTKAGHKFIGWDSEIAATMPANDLRYKAKWETISSTVSFEGLGSESNMTVTYGGTYGELPVPTKHNYVFEGWFTQSSDGEKINKDAPVIITADQILYPQWTGEIFILTWGFHDAVPISDDYTRGEVPYGTEIIAPVVSRAGLIFKRWHNPYVFENIYPTMPNIDVHYEMIWEAETYPITLDLAGGEIVGWTPTEYSYGVGLGELTDSIKRPGYKFEGWYEGDTPFAGISKTSVGPKHYTARWSIATYTVTYHFLEGASNHEANIDTYQMGDKFAFGQPTKIGYDFEGWHSWWRKFEGGDEVFDDPITGIKATDARNWDVYAKWKVQEYTITLDLNGGRPYLAGLWKNTIPYTYGKLITLPTIDQFTKDPSGDYAFKGWFDGESFITEISPGTMGDKKCTAIWEIKTDIADIKYELKGGTNSQDNPTTHDRRTGGLYLADPTRLHYIFNGWYFTPSLNAPAYNPITVNAYATGVTLYAKWIPISYRVEFYGNGAEGTMNSQTFKYDESKELSSNQFIRTGYNFVGWSTSSNGNKLYENKELVLNLKDTNEAVVMLYSLWTIVDYTIEYNLNGGANVGNPTTYTVETPKITLKETTRDKYLFKGWYDNPSFTGDEVRIIGPGAIGNRKLYAKWEAKKDVTGINAAAQTAYYDGDPKKFAIKGTDVDNLKVEYKKQGEDTWKDEAINVGKYSVRITRPISESYNAFEREIQNALEIMKVKRIMNAPTGGTANLSTILVNEAKPANGVGDGVIEYAASLSQEAPQYSWSSSLSVSNLYKTGDYYLFARISDGENYFGATSAASVNTVRITNTSMLTERKWKVGVQTGYANGDGTDAKVEIRFHYRDADSGDWHELNNPGNDHEKGGYDEYTVTEMQDPWMVSGFGIGNDGTNAGSWWKCEYVDLTIGDNGKKSFNVKRGFDNEYADYNIGGFFNRRITSVGQLNNWSGSHALNSTSKGTKEYTFDGIITDQYGTYNAYQHAAAPTLTVGPSQPGYTDCFSYDSKSFKINEQKLYEKMLATGLNQLEFTIKLNFDYLSTSYAYEDERTKTITINRK